MSADREVAAVLPAVEGWRAMVVQVVGPVVDGKADQTLTLHRIASWGLVFGVSYDAWLPLDSDGKVIESVRDFARPSETNDAAANRLVGDAVPLGPWERVKAPSEEVET